MSWMAQPNFWRSEDVACPGRPVTAWTKVVWNIIEIVREDRSLSVPIIVNRMNTNEETSWYILQDEFNKSGPEILTQVQKNSQKNICSNIMKPLTEETDLLTNVITCISWKYQSMHWRNPNLKEWKNYELTSQNWGQHWSCLSISRVLSWLNRGSGSESD